MNNENNNPEVRHLQQIRQSVITHWLKSHDVRKVQYNAIFVDMSKKKTTKVSIPEEVIISKIYLIRGQKVMLDRDLAELYGVETKRLKEQVRRNKDRFPNDFMFEMSKEELEDWRPPWLGRELRPSHGGLQSRSNGTARTAVCIYRTWGGDAGQRTEQPTGYSS